MTGNPAENPAMFEWLEALSESELSDVQCSDESLLAVIRADSSGLKARFHACEILLRRDQRKFLSMLGAQTVAGIYVSALRERTTIDLNPWAFLGLGELGPTGLHLVACGEDAVAALVPLLDSKDEAGLYSGSEEAKEGNSDRARFCDFAAFFVARIRHHSYTFHRNNLALRDAEVDALSKDLE